MKVFVVHFGGYTLGGSMVIVDETKEMAFEQAKAKLKSMKLADVNEGAYFSIDNPDCIEEIDVTTKNLLVVDDGNY